MSVRETLLALEKRFFSKAFCARREQKKLATTLFKIKIFASFTK